MVYQKTFVPSHRLQLRLAINENKLFLAFDGNHNIGFGLCAILMLLIHTIGILLARIFSGWIEFDVVNLVTDEGLAAGDNAARDVRIGTLLDQPDVLDFKLLLGVHGALGVPSRVDAHFDVVLRLVDRVLGHV